MFLQFICTLAISIGNQTYNNKTFSNRSTNKSTSNHNECSLVSSDTQKRK